MKITEKIAKAEADDRDFWSFEYFPPKTEQGVLNLYDRMERMYALGPEFVDVTWGAGGGTSDLTIQICQTAHTVYGLEACMHLTCTNMPREKIDIALREAKEAGIENILALRGDPPRGQSEWTSCDTGFSYATDLVRYIREQYGDHFCIGVAAYPEGHIDTVNKADDLKYLKQKMDAGADYIVTQLFYDTELYIHWYRQVREMGITAPILPGIMPIQSYGGFSRMTFLCKTVVPQAIHDALEPIKNDDKAVKEYGVQLAIEMVKRLREVGIRGFHFYTLNLEKSVRLILEGLEFVAPIEVAKPLPWNPSLSRKREKEGVRPVFWKHRLRSYILRTEAWDEFPNGRWGDSRSPAFGEIGSGGYGGVSFKHTRDECLAMWGTPLSKDDIAQVFQEYCRGTIGALPWSEMPLAPEASSIRGQLARINKLGYLTINSQPAVDGVSSQDAVFGWGPANGYVYQKAYLEFFVSAQGVDALVAQIKQSHPTVTYYAVNRAGDLRTNTQSEGPNAVTWGVFPGQEIVQPTVVEATSFMAWKDEAFALWSEWHALYPANSPSAQHLHEIQDTWFLMNIVENNFKAPESVFELFDKAPVMNGKTQCGTLA